MSATGLVGANGKQVFVSWRRGSKKKNSGRTKKALCENGAAEWNDLGEEPIKVTSTMTRDIKTHKFEEKMIGLSLKKLIQGGESNKTQSSSVAHIMLNLSDYANNDTNLTKFFPLQLKSRSRISKTSTQPKLEEKSNAQLEINITCKLEQTTLEESDKLENSENSEEVKDNNSNNNASPSDNNKNIQKVDTVAFGKPLLGQLIVHGSRKYIIPPVLSVLIEGVNLHGLTRQGIFRLSGRSAQVTEMIATLNDNPANLDLESCGPHELADCLKKYLRALPNSLLPDSFYEKALELGAEYEKIYESNKNTDEQNKQLNVKLGELLSTFPPANAAALRELCVLLYKIQEFCEENKMTTDNLAVVFAPTVIQKEFDDPTRFLLDNSKKVAIMKALILYSPFWMANENFSEIDEKLKKEEDSLPPEVRIHRVLERLAESEKEKEKLRNDIQSKQDQIECYELREFIYSTPSLLWNSSRSMWQAAIDIYDHWKQIPAFIPFNRPHLYAMIRGLQVLHRVSIFLFQPFKISDYKM